MSLHKKDRAEPRTYVTAVLILLFFIIFLFFMYAINGGMEISWEKSVQAFFQSWDKGGVHTFFVYWTELGSTWMTRLSAVLLMVFLIWKKKDWIGAIISGGLVYGAQQLNGFVKGLVARDRPMIDPSIDATGYSFPSGHSMASMVTYGLIAFFLVKYVFRQKNKLLVWLGFALLILSIGISRIVLSAHFPTDVAAGYSLGLSCLLLSLSLYDMLISFSGKKRKHE
ncbi:phosphatase PAP2 family protein [Bacillus sp. 1P06AnD]|uniref:phosphatase PAP2 family protein n=1 Tax=Bacillus sp. 1P06AnD TaxID=3132208 RepID=UPI0039A069BA